MAEGLFDFFSRARGQERRAALEGLLTQFIPPELRPQLGLLAEANPVVSMERAGQDAQTVFAPDVALMDRLAAGGRMASNMAGVLAPVAAGRAVGMAPVQAVQEGLLGLSATPQVAAVRDFAADESGALRLTLRGDYAGSHTAPELLPGATLDNPADIWGSDIYSPQALRYFGTGDDALDKQSLAAIRAARSNPDAEVPIFRAVPLDAPDDINAGDWVTTSARYARDHGESALGGEYKIVTEMVKAKELATDGNSIHEWGWWPSQERLAEAGLLSQPAPTDPIAERGAQIMDMLRSGRGADVTEDMLDMGDPVQNARLNEWLFSNYDLPMDAASRAARAGEMGMNTPLLHGTAGDEFLSFREGSASLPVDRAIWSSTTPEGGPNFIAASRMESAGQDSGRVIPLMARTGNNLVVDATGKHAVDVRGVRNAAADGFDAVTLENVREFGSPDLTTSVAVFDPSNLRSRFARFDPRLSHLRNLNAALAGGIPLYGLLSTQPEQEQY